MQYKKAKVFWFILLLFIPFVMSETGTLELRDPSGEVILTQSKDWSSGTSDISFQPVDSATYCTQEGQWDLAFRNEVGGNFSRASHYVNWDADSVACECLATNQIYPTEWNDAVPVSEISQIGGPCCGDDGIDDLGFITPSPQEGKYICTNNTDDHYTWVHVAEQGTSGDVYFIDKGTYDVVSNGEKWHACDAKGDGYENFNESLGVVVVVGDTVLAGHHYLCYNNGGVERFAECTGDGSSLNANIWKYGEVKSTGDAIITTDAVYFCTNNYFWATNLDEFDGATCEAAGLKWTGSKCCGDDKDDTYNDEDWEGNPEAEGYTIGGCFNNIKVNSNSLISDTNLVENGYFSSGMSKWEAEGQNIGISGGELKLGHATSVSQEVSRNIFEGGTYELKAKVNSIKGIAIVSILAGTDKSNLAELVDSRLTANDEGPLYLSEEFTIPAGSDIVEVYAYATGAGSTSFIDDIELHFAKKDIMNFEGSFSGCNLDEEERKSYTDVETDDDLIPKNRNEDLCSIKGDYFCSESFGWETPHTIDGEPRDTEKSTPELYNQSSGSCCPPEYCWNGTICTGSEHYSPDPINPIIIDDNSLYRCIYGDWKFSVVKHTWDFVESGFCPSLTQCLVDKNGDSNNNDDPSKYGGIYGTENPQCIESNQFIEDHLCDNGTWSSRTKALALSLLNIIDEKSNKEDYTLFCGNQSRTLNRYDYNTATGNNAEEYIRGKLQQKGPLSIYTCSGDANYEMPCINNFCVLRYQDKYDNGKEKIVMGASLNQPVNAADLSFLETLSKDADYCNNLVGEGNTFDKCSEDESIWYDDNFNLLLISPEGIDLEEPSFWDKFWNWFTNPIQSMLSLINPKSMGVIPLAYEANDYSNIYTNFYDGKSIAAILEPHAKNPFIAINYTGFSQDICLSIMQYDDARFQGAGSIVCNETEDDQYSVYTQGTQAFYLWSDLTSKSRLSGEYYAGESPGFEQN